MKAIFSLCIVIFLAFFSFNYAAEDKGIPSILLESVVAGDEDGIFRALKNGENINLVNMDGMTAARIAAQLSNHNVLRTLIDEKIDLNIPDKNGVTPLMVAAENAQKEIVELLLASNANPYQLDVDGRDAYLYAKDSRRPIIEYIIAEGAALYGLNNADLVGVMESVKRGAFPEIRNAVGWTPLILAAYVGDANAVKDLIALGVNPNRVENDGWTALHMAAHEGHEDVVKILIEAGAGEARSWTNKKGDRPIDIAKSRGHTKLLDILKDL